MGIRPSLKYGQTASPSFEPLTLAELKAHCRVDDATDDTLITSLGIAARQYVENRTAHILCGRAFYLEASSFPTGNDPLVLPIGAVQSVSSITYVDTSGAVQTWSSGDYRVQTNLLQARIRPALTVSAYPATAIVDDAVRLSVVAGYANAAAVPEMAKHAIRLLVAHWYENREGVINGTISSDVKLTVEALLRSLWVAEVVV
jgi:uncharacterized phiE125 gp8 family phage protein